MLGYYFKIWQNIEKDERGSIWRRFATNAPFFAKAFLAVLILCLLGFVASALLPSDFAVTVQIAILAFTLVSPFSIRYCSTSSSAKACWATSGVYSSRLSV